MTTIIEHPNVPATEYCLPFSIADLDSGPDWLQPFAEKSPTAVAQELTKRWSRLTGAAARLADWYCSLSPKSVGQFGDSWCLVSEQPDEPLLFFIPEPDPLGDESGVPEHIAAFLSPFLCVMSGVPFYPLEGFRTSLTVQIADFDNENEQFWHPDPDELDPAWDGATAFYDTGCGNRLLFNEDGSVGKWDHETCSIETCCNTADDFVSEYIRYFTSEESSDCPLFT